MATSLRTFVAIMSVAALAGPAASQEWTAQQVDLSASIRLQGRVMAISVSPATSTAYVVGTETGGLFRTVDGGRRFQRANQLPHRISDVLWLTPVPRTTPRVILVTTRSDFRLPNGGGIWRSVDGGGIWSQANLAATLALPAANDISAYSIAQDTWTPNIAVATNKGLALSRNRGETWTIVNPFSPGSATCLLVTYAYSNILVAGPSGLRWSTDNGRTWNPPVTRLPGTAGNNYHGLTWSKRDGMAYYVDAAGGLWYTIDYGQNWTMITGAPARANGAGGDGFIYEANRGLRSETLDLYYGDTRDYFRLRTRGDLRSSEIDLTGRWTVMDRPHMDIHCMAFSRDGDPYLLGTDGGLHTTRDSGRTFVAEPHPGLESLQLYDVGGQWVGTGRDRKHDLYIGTQDNHHYASGDRGITWPHETGVEGGDFEMLPDVRLSTPVITYSPNYGGSVTFEKAGRYYAGHAPGVEAARRRSCCRETFTDTNGNGFWDRGEPLVDTNRDGVWNDDTADRSVFTVQPVMHSSGRLIQRIEIGARVTDEALQSGLAVSDPSARTWSQLATIQTGTFDDGSGTRSVTVSGWWGHPMLSSSGRDVRVFHAFRGNYDAAIGDERAAVLYVSTTDAFGAPSPVYPRMDGFGSIGRTSYQFVWAPVVAAHPANRTALAAADAKTTWPGRVGTMIGGVSFSADAGQTWTLNRELTYMVLGRTKYIFVLGGSNLSLVSAISYCPYDPRVMLIGCREGGVYVTTNGGVDWSPVTGSSNMINVSAFHWLSSTEAYAATFGTGLWHVFSILGPTVEVRSPSAAAREITAVVNVPAVVQRENVQQGVEGRIEFVGGTDDPHQPRYVRNTITVRLIGWSPRSSNDLQVLIDGERLPDQSVSYEPSLNELRFKASGRGGHALRVIWIDGNRRSETGGMFFVGGDEDERKASKPSLQQVGKIESPAAAAPLPVPPLMLSADQIVRAAKTSRGTLELQSLPGSPDKPGATYAEWKGAVAESSLTFSINSSATGAYTLTGSFVRNANSGVVAMFFDGKAVGESITLRSDRPTVGKYAFGTVMLTPGIHEIDLRIAPGSTSGSTISLLAVGFEPTDEKVDIKAKVK